ncbi:succinate dehydrogenase, hydrophobic membrane anchor protein [Oceanibacterium hippocampi]|uniref:Succinate dehydrogenase hydrophobic membrane anchor subunit n=1 Tax=Oceanibacterium hippocampi TaxID=745714 RepID=A0A1Y5RGB8_9PROT|nr:succinate dehydrogenase, hydrophobic membrane anchor protein [Oceanibacterium hippocampi]SLN14011.1 Succinate dehydrogenase/Fumarate reductase transmembrane subunit [Oceanibacterium hippocampi]
MSLVAPLKKVRRLGSAKEGTHHWWHQRLTAVALIPLVLVFAGLVIALTGADYDAARSIMASPFATIVAAVLVAVLFYHLLLGLQVVIEDYVHGEAAKLVMLTLVKFAVVIVGVASMWAVLKLGFGG